MTPAFEPTPTPSVEGFVSIVGAGPGDPDLLTVKAVRRLNAADLVLHDRLVGDGVIESIPIATDVQNVGKGPDGSGVNQAEINRRMVRAAEKGQTVVRLKGGDPGVFGRGGEEAEYLAAHSIPFELVPGVTSAIAAPAATGIPLTHREHASAVAVVTGHEDPTKSESALDWDALAQTVTAGGTLVILMGVTHLAGNVRQLLDGGVPPETPAAMIERATLEDEVVIKSSLETITSEAQEVEIQPPATTVIGDVIEVGHAVDRWLNADTAKRPNRKPIPVTSRFDPHP